MTITIKLTREQARELSSLLWECCTETDDGIKYLREDLPLSAIWRIVAEAIAPDKDYTDDKNEIELLRKQVDFYKCLAEFHAKTADLLLSDWREQWGDGAQPSGDLIDLTDIYLSREKA